MVRIQERISQAVIFVGKLHHRMGKDLSLLHAVSLGEGAGGDVADNHLQRYNADLFHQSLSGAQLPDKVGGDTHLFQVLHQAVAHLVVDDSLTFNGALFQAVEGGGIVLIIHNQQLRVLRGIDFFGFTLVKHLFLFHKCAPISQIYFTPNSSSP